MSPLDGPAHSRDAIPLSEADVCAARPGPRTPGFARTRLAPLVPHSTDDTDPAVEAILIEGYRQMTPSQKLERVRALTRAVQVLALADIRRRHPDADEREQALRLASRWIERDLMVRAFGWDVRETGY